MRMGWHGFPVRECRSIRRRYSCNLESQLIGLERAGCHWRRAKPLVVPGKLKRYLVERLSVSGEEEDATTAQDVYDESVRPLPPRERLRLAALILDDLAEANAATDAADAWTAKDQADVAAFSLGYAATLYPEDDKLV